MVRVETGPGRDRPADCEAGEGMTVGLDVDTLKMTMQAIDEFAERYLPNERLLELDHEDRCPEETVRQMCGEELGVQMVFIPEEFSGMCLLYTSDAADE